jgi:hypothetical protein
VSISRLVAEWLLPALICRCCGQVTTADAPPGARPGSICYGPGTNTAAVLLAGYGNVPAERTAHLIGMLLGMPVSAGFVDKAASRLDGCATPGSMTRCRPRWPPSRRSARTRPRSACSPLSKTRTPASRATGPQHVLIIRPPGGKLTWLRALGSRPAAAITAILGFFTGFLITDGYTAYQ